MTVTVTILRFRYAIAAVVAGGAGVFDSYSGLYPTDLATFLRAGRLLLSGEWSNVFANPEVQVGPLYLAGWGVVRSVATVAAVDPRTLLGVVVEVIVVLGTMLVVRTVTERNPVAESAAGVVALGSGMAWVAYISGHVEEFIVGGLLLLAGRAAYTDRAEMAGVWVGLAGTLKLWGFLGIPLVLLARRRERGVLLVVLIAAVAFLPFWVFGEVNTFEFRWAVSSLLLVGLVGDRFTWLHRAIQAGLTVGVGVFVALRGRFLGARIVWVLPLIIVTTRIVLDPVPQYYFWLPFDLLAIAGVADLCRGRSWRDLTVLGGFVYALIVFRYLPLGISLSLRTVAVLVLVVLAARWSDPAPRAVPGLGR